VTSAADTLSAIAARLRDLTPITSVVAADLMTFVDDRFASSTAPDGSAWAELKSRVGTVLVDTSRLRNSIFGRGQRAGLQFGTNVPYAGHHQLGTERIPQRAFLPVESSGSAFVLDTRGPAGTFWADARSRIAHFIRTGEVT
jgi:phage gpG-like protein